MDSQNKSLEVYKLNKEFTRVVSPIDGQVSRYYLTLGNLVNQDQTLLTTIVSLDPMYVYFDMDESTLLRIRKAIAEGKITVPADGHLPVRLGLQNEDGFPARGDDHVHGQPGQLDDREHHGARHFRKPQADSGEKERGGGIEGRVRGEGPGGERSRAADGKGLSCGFRRYDTLRSPLFARHVRSRAAADRANRTRPC